MNARSPNEIDIYIGERIKSFRLALGMSRERLAGSLGITLQQVQKYEKGTNRVSASRLVMIAKGLGVTAASLLPDDGARNSGELALLLALTRERDALADKLARIEAILSPEATPESAAGSEDG